MLLLLNHYFSSDHGSIGEDYFHWICAVISMKIKKSRKDVISKGKKRVACWREKIIDKIVEKNWKMADSYGN